MKMKKLTVMVPCYNEEKGITKVISKIPRAKLKALGYEVEVLVIDNNSKDRTTEVAKKAGARVVFEGKQGKGHAIRKGVKSITTDTDLVVMLDGDDTYDPREMLRLIEPLDSNFCDVVIGSRLGGKIKEGSMTMFNRTGNWFFTFLVRMFYHGNVTDVCTGYFAWKRPVLKKLSKHLEADGFSIEMEMITKMAKMKFDIYSVPISYEHRAGDTALQPIGDGKKILHAWMKNLTWKPYAKYQAK
ncbi:glycosyltransferase [archaeon]|jgi:dolichol-phosphate hexosyltransferase|nr:glycosyltransferase [archaeon]MBT7281616.1 glycosyltransferase [archaeon]